MPIYKETPNADIRVVGLDLADESSIRAAAKEVLALNLPINVSDGLVRFRNFERLWLTQIGTMIRSLLPTPPSLSTALLSVQNRGSKHSLGPITLAISFSHLLSSPRYVLARLPPSPLESLS